MAHRYKTISKILLISSSAFCFLSGVGTFYFYGCNGALSSLLASLCAGFLTGVFFLIVPKVRKYELDEIEKDIKECNQLIQIRHSIFCSNIKLAGKQLPNDKQTIDILLTEIICYVQELISLLQSEKHNSRDIYTYECKIDSHFEESLTYFAEKAKKMKDEFEATDDTTQETVNTILELSNYVSSWMDAIIKNAEDFIDKSIGRRNQLVKSIL